MTEVFKWWISMGVLISIVSFGKIWANEAERGEISQNPIPLELIGEWQLQSMKVNNQLYEIPPNLDVSLIIQKDGKIYGKAPVNRFFGGIEIKNGEWKCNQPMGVTMMAGEEKLMELERNYLESLEKVRTVHLKDDQLILKTENERTVLCFVGKNNLRKKNLIKE